MFRYLLILGVLCQGCATYQSRMEHMWADVREIRESCFTKKRLGEFHTLAEAVECAHPETNRIMISAWWPYMDLTYLRNIQELALAKQVDAGSITKDEANLKMAQIDVEQTGEMQRRWALEQQTNAQIRQADAVRMQAFNQAIQPYIQQPVQPQQNSTVCIEAVPGIIQCK